MSFAEIRQCDFNEMNLYLQSYGQPVQMRK